MSTADESKGETWLVWEKCGPFDEMWTVEERTPTGRIIAECCEEWRADAIVADHEAAQQLATVTAALAEAEQALTDQYELRHRVKHAHSHTTDWMRCVFEECHAHRERLARIVALKGDTARLQQPYQTP